MRNQDGQVVTRRVVAVVLPLAALIGWGGAVGAVGGVALAQPAVHGPTGRGVAVHPLGEFRAPADRVTPGVVVVAAGAGNPWHG
jgi:hypothetical protein